MKNNNITAEQLEKEQKNIVHGFLWGLKKRDIFLISALSIPFLIYRTIRELKTELDRLSLGKRLWLAKNFLFPNQEICNFYEKNKHAINFDYFQEYPNPKLRDNVKIDLLKSLKFKTRSLVLHEVCASLEEIAQYKQTYPDMLQYLVEEYRPSPDYIEQFRFDDFLTSHNGKTYLKDDLQTVIKAACLCPPLLWYAPSRYSYFREVFLACLLSLPRSGSTYFSFHPILENDESNNPVFSWRMDEAHKPAAYLKLYEIVQKERQETQDYESIRGYLLNSQLGQPELIEILKKYRDNNGAFNLLANNDRGPYDSRNHRRDSTDGLVRENRIAVYHWIDNREPLYDSLMQQSPQLDDDEEEEPIAINKI